MRNMNDTHLGEIIRLYDTGTAVVLDEHCDEQYVFGFDKIHDYGGEYPKELKQFSKKGLKIGVKVRFTLDSTLERIEKVTPVNP